MTIWLLHERLSKWRQCDCTTTIRGWFDCCISGESSVAWRSPNDDDDTTMMQLLHKRRVGCGLASSTSWQWWWQCDCCIKVTTSILRQFDCCMTTMMMMWLLHQQISSSSDDNDTYWGWAARWRPPSLCLIEFDQTTNQVHVRSPIFLRWRQATWFDSNYCHTRGRRWATTTTKTIVNVEDCVAGRLLMLWREDFYLGRKILLLTGRSFFLVGKVIATRQFRPCCKVVCFGKESSINGISQRIKYKDCT